MLLDEYVSFRDPDASNRNVFIYNKYVWITVS